MTDLKHDIDDEQPIQIRATAKRNGLSSLIFGVVLLIIAILMFRILPDDVTLVACCWDF